MRNRKLHFFIGILIGLVFFGSLGHIRKASAEFEDVSLLVGLEIEENPSKKAFGNPTWVDFNNDGHLDMISPRHEHDPSVYLNNGDGTFENIFSQSGLYPDGRSDHHGFAWGDYDNDGNMDLFVAEGSFSDSIEGLSQLWRGDGEGHFTRVTQEAGINEKGRTANWTDYNNDGHLDVLLQLPLGAVLYENNGDGSFSDKTEDAGLGVLTDRYCGVGSFADYDNDGDMDLLIQAETLKLFNNNGSGEFLEVSFPVGQANEKAIAWGDYDNDQDLDVFVSRGTGDYYGGLVLEDSKITFSDMMFNFESPEGLTFTTTGGNVSFALYLRGNLCPLTNIYIGSEKAHPQENPFTLENAIGEPEFTPGVDYGFYIWKDSESDSWHLQWSTPDNRTGFYGHITLEDGQQVVQAVPSYELRQTDFTLELYRNDGDDTFTRVTDQAGLEHIGNHKGGAVWGDYDNDGDLDLYAVDIGNLAGNNPNLLYRNNGDGTFTERASDENITAIDVIGRHYGAAWGDYNNDGFLDLFLSNGNGWGYPLAWGNEAFYRNLGNDNHWVKVKLEGVMTNRSALGSRVEIEANGQVQFRHLNGGGGGEFYSQGSGPLHFGLGSNTMVDNLNIRWPSGIVQEVYDMPADQMIRLIEPVPSNLKGKPLYQTGIDEGVYLWKDNFDGPYHLRVSGSGPRADYEIKIISDQPLVDIFPYSLEGHDNLDILTNSFFLQSRVYTGQDGVDFKLQPGARALIAIEREGVPNPRQIHVGTNGHPLTPGGWILSSMDLPQRPSFDGGEDLGLFFGHGEIVNTMEVRWNGDGFPHRARFHLFSAVPILNVDAIGLEPNDILTHTSHTIDVDARMSAWWDGVDVGISELADIGIAYEQDALFQPHRVNTPSDSLGMPNAYWIPVATDGEPDFDPAAEAGVFLWEDEERMWHLRATAGGDYARYIGTIEADQAPNSVTGYSLEGNDQVEVMDLTHIRFDLRMSNGWQDGIDFEFPAGTNFFLNLETPSNAVDVIRIGEEEWPVTQLPVQLSGSY